jgi:hypothetical protein
MREETVNRIVGIIGIGLLVAGIFWRLRRLVQKE